MLQQNSNGDDLERKARFPSCHLAQLGFTTFDFVARQQGLIANDNDDSMQKVILPGTLIPQARQLTTDTDHPHRDRNGVDSRPVRASTRQRRKMLDQFLVENGFGREVDEPKNTQQAACYFWKRPETTFPLHVAAAQGDIEIIRLLLSERVDPLKQTSRGRTALAVARSAGVKNDEVFQLLSGEVQVLSLREALTLLSTTR
ncbi:hypothetical protein AK812_SmicGene49144 [Symbiodinium microadriaticum]|uniref:Uncharacterized protein n=1 Tax=Symbiodinium microadriaticum TaxID=2951 RepID=A0A1Q9EEZ9_SYMMI|nr:hypothetical protein AK812_SmicGene49144 [Symbiodinium microadriaticum]